MPHATLRTLIATVALGAALPLCAADADGRFMVEGAGRAECSRFLAAQSARNPELVSFAGWLDGYLTALHQVTPETFDLAPWQDTELLLAAVGNWCRKQPGETFHTAVYRMMETLRPGRLAARSAFVTVTVGERTAVLYADILRRLQEQLARRGYLDGAPSGAWDAATAAALRAFQAERGLPATGFPDQVTLAGLL